MAERLYRATRGSVVAGIVVSLAGGDALVIEAAPILKAAPARVRRGHDIQDVLARLERQGWTVRLVE